jgi:hypothetical protein
MSYVTLCSSPSEATSRFCNEPRHLSFLVDVTDEGRPERPEAVSTPQLSAAEGDFCTRGGRFGFPFDQ